MRTLLGADLDALADAVVGSSEVVQDAAEEMAEDVLTDVHTYLLTARPRIEPVLLKSMPWDMMLPLFKSLDTIEELEKALEDPLAFVQLMDHAAGGFLRLSSGLRYILGYIFIK